MILKIDLRNVSWLERQPNGFKPLKVGAYIFTESVGLGSLSLHLQVYSVSVSAFLGGSKPSRFGNVRGEVAVSFSCDPDVAWKSVNPSLIDYSYTNESLLVLILD